MTKQERTIFHVVPTSARGALSGWAVKRLGDGERPRHFPHSNARTKRDAVAFAVRAAKQLKPSQLVIHNRDGKIAEERTYGRDPRRTKG